MQLKAAMQEMDTDGNGSIDLEEFQTWWHANGGDLESKREFAMAIDVTGGEQLLLVRNAAQFWLQPSPRAALICSVGRNAPTPQVARDLAQKQRWLTGLSVVLGKEGRC